MPPSIKERLPEGRPGRFVREVVATLDLSAIEGTYSSRRMAAKLVDEVAYRILAAGNVPDLRTLSDSRKTHAVALNYARMSEREAALKQQVAKARQVTPRGPEVHELLPAVDAMERDLGRTAEQGVEDAGYWSQGRSDRRRNHRSLDPGPTGTKIGAHHPGPRIVRAVKAVTRTGC